MAVLVGGAAEGRGALTDGACVDRLVDRALRGLVCVVGMFGASVHKFLCGAAQFLLKRGLVAGVFEHIKLLLGLLLRSRRIE